MALIYLVGKRPDSAVQPTSGLGDWDRLVNHGLRSRELAPGLFTFNPRPNGWPGGPSGLPVIQFIR
jgi:hypothetical protein